MSTDDRISVCMDDHRSTGIYKQTHGSTIKDSRGSTCTDAHRTMSMDVSTVSTGVHIITCWNVSTKSTGMHGGMCMDVSTVKAVIHESICDHDKYGIHRPKWACIEPGMKHIVMDTVGKIIEGVSYADMLQCTQGS